MGTLPNPGGLFDQHPQHVKKMELVLKAQHERDKVPDQKTDAEQRLQERAG